MTSIFDVAKFILDKRGKATTYELQKLCYYCKAWSLALGEGEMFPEKFQAWPHGPVCYDLFKEHQSEYNVTNRDISRGSKDNVSPADSDIIFAVMDVNAGLDGKALEKKTHEEAPWIITRGDLAPDAKCTRVIGNDIMQAFYRETPEFDEVENAFLMRRAERREAASTETYSFAEMMELLGITAEEIDEAEDIEFELE